MATLHQALEVVIGAADGITALVSTRSYYEEAPQTATLPYLVRENVVGDPLGLPLDGVSTLDRTRVQFVAWAATPLAADQIRQAVIAALAGYAGTVAIPNSGSPPETFEIQGTIVDVQVSIPDESEPVSARSYGRSVDIIFHHQP
jgi:hypothetical protein